MTDWKTKAAQKREQQTSTIPAQWRLESIPTDAFLNAREYIKSSNLLTPTEHSITSITDARLLAGKIASSEYTSVEVVTAFCKRAALAQQLTRCCTEMFFERALERARFLDTFLEKEGRVLGPLHGVPVSFKDNFDVEGVDSTIGWVGRIGKPAKADSLGVDLLLRLGAVVYVKTNVPQSLMMSDSYNHVFKQSVNSLNANLISGGSSGGEGALVAASGSILGIGTDIGGSVRIPAVLQGLYGMSPTVGRVSNDPSGRTQQYIVCPVAGPLTTSLSTLELYFEAHLGAEPWNVDPGLLPVPWRQKLAVPPSRPLKLGFIYDDGVTKCQPPIERLTRRLAAELKSAGHEVIEWDSSDHQEGYDLWLKAVLADGGKGCKALCDLIGEPLIEGMLVGHEENFLSPAQRQELEEQKTQYKRRYLQKWVSSGVDALIMPVTPYVGFKPKTWVVSDTIVSYTSQWNFVDYSALAIPLGKVDGDLDMPSEDWTAYCPRGKADDFNHKQYDVELVKGMPVGVQIIGGRFGEENCVAVAKVVAGLVGEGW